jgi:hypothetical protein
MTRGEITAVLTAFDTIDRCVRQGARLELMRLWAFLHIEAARPGTPPEDRKLLHDIANLFRRTVQEMNARDDNSGDRMARYG